MNATFEMRAGIDSTAPCAQGMRYLRSGQGEGLRFRDQPPFAGAAGGVGSSGRAPRVFGQVMQLLSFFEVFRYAGLRVSRPGSEGVKS